MKDSQVHVEREAGGVKNVKDLRSLHWGLAKIFDMRISSLSHTVTSMLENVLFGCVRSRW
jgi:hypothetical protein